MLTDVGVVICQKFQRINLAYKRLITDNENVSMSKVSRPRYSVVTTTIELH